MWSGGHIAHFTLLNRGFLRLALEEAPLEAEAKMAPALSLEIPSRLAIEA